MEPIILFAAGSFIVIIFMFELWLAVRAGWLY
jgi:hypothetical protein